MWVCEYLNQSIFLYMKNSVINLLDYNLSDNLNTNTSAKPSDELSTQFDYHYLYSPFEYGGQSLAKCLIGLYSPFAYGGYQAKAKFGHML